VAYRHPLAFLLGLEGVALLQAFAGDGFDRVLVERRIAEIRTLLNEAAPLLGDAEETDQIDSVDAYGVWSANYGEPGNPLIEVEESAVRRILDRLPAGDALDSACGTGRHARYLVARGHRVIGVDSSPDMLARPGAPAHADLRHGDLHRLPVGDGEVDLVVCSLALTHVAALAPVLAEFVRVLRSGGHLVISDIHAVSLYLGGVASIRRPDGRLGLLPATRYLPSDYLRAALPLGLQVRDCQEPRWPGSRPGGWAGGAAMVPGGGKGDLRRKPGRDHLAPPTRLITNRRCQRTHLMGSAGRAVLLFADRAACVPRVSIGDFVLC
jgi:SAM-dependent methyltransferase